VLWWHFVRTPSRLFIHNGPRTNVSLSWILELCFRFKYKIESLVKGHSVLFPFPCHGDRPEGTQRYSQRGSGRSEVPGSWPATARTGPALRNGGRPGVSEVESPTRARRRVLFVCLLLRRRPRRTSSAASRSQIGECLPGPCFLPLFCACSSCASRCFELSRGFVGAVLRRLG
jgi:hypothetical protein